MACGLHAQSWSHTASPSPYLPHYSLFSWSTDSTWSETYIRASDSLPLASQGPGIEFQIHDFRIWLLSAFTPLPHLPTLPQLPHPNTPPTHPGLILAGIALAAPASMFHSDTVCPQPGPLPGRLVLTFRALLQGHLLLEALLIVLPPNCLSLFLILLCFSSYASEHFM